MPCSGPEIVVVERVEIAVAPWRWDFAHARADDITRHFAARQRERPALWNGRVLLLHRFTVENGVLRGSSFETDYASFLAWRDWGCPDAGVFNVFAAAALQAADGAYLVGRMAPFTSIAGRSLFPCGTPDPEDISAGMLDLAGSARRELFEETGLDIGTMQVEAGRTLVRDNGFVALIKRVIASENAAGFARAHPAPSGGRDAAGVFGDPHSARHCGRRCGHAALPEGLSGGGLV